ncbi:MarC family integral membrane protein [uncultured archaeon]|nr:MarC family integral membrane protein [uncultured archaeon]
MLSMFDTAIILQIFVLLNPLSSFPVLMSAQKKKLDVGSIAIKASVAAYAVAVCIILFGPQFFSLYGISINSFRIAGGVILFLLGVETVRPKPVREEVNEVDSLIAIIATPLLTGPAVMSFLTIRTIEMGVLPVLVQATGAFFVVGLVFWLFSLFLPRINPKVIEIVSKVMGLFLTAIAIEMIAKGSTALFASLATA